MFTHLRHVLLKETDATGVIYFSSLFEYSLEAFEKFLHEKGISLSQIFAKGYFMPIVHAEADYKAPLKAGDTLSIELTLSHIGNRSFSMDSTIKILPGLKEAGRVKIVHAFIKQGEEKASEIPSEIRDLLIELTSQPIF